MLTADCGFRARDGLTGSDLLTIWGPTLGVQIGFDPGFAPSAAALPELGHRLFPALVDTGGQESCIDSSLAEELNLPLVEQATVAGAHGSGAVDLYLAQIHVPALEFTVTGRFAGVHLAAGQQEHRALIGRTFLRWFSMRYEGRTGMVVLTTDPAPKARFVPA